uniref:Uncharacterized protein n=2 Tax=Clytia hemisphaerica TaxID=252671 RepID=A0A7M5WQX9_9CNID
MANVNSFVFKKVNLGLPVAKPKSSGFSVVCTEKRQNFVKNTSATTSKSADKTTSNDCDLTVKPVDRDSSTKTLTIPENQEKITIDTDDFTMITDDHKINDSTNTDDMNTNDAIQLDKVTNLDNVDTSTGTGLLRDDHPTDETVTKDATTDDIISDTDNTVTDHEDCNKLTFTDNDDSINKIDMITVKVDESLDIAAIIHQPTLKTTPQNTREVLSNLGSIIPSSCSMLSEVLHAYNESGARQDHCVGDDFKSLKMEVFALKIENSQLKEEVISLKNVVANMNTEISSQLKDIKTAIERNPLIFTGEETLPAISVEDLQMNFDKPQQPTKDLGKMATAGL